MMRPLALTFAAWTLCCAAAALPAQSPLAAKSFLPADYRNVVFADLAAMRDKGVWDELQASLLKTAFQQMEKEAGFELRALDRVTSIANPGSGTSWRDTPDATRVFVLEGNSKLGFPESVLQNWTEEQVGKFTVRALGDRELYVNPRPELLVFGSASVVRPVLEGKPNAGLPSADVMSLLSGRGDSLAYFVFDTALPLLRNEVLGRLFPDTKWDDGQAPVFVCVRVVATGDADDPHLGVEAVLRHAAAGGMDVSSKAADALLERLQAMPEMRGVKPLLQRVEKKRDRSDLVYALDLGRVREAVGHVASLAGPLFRTRSTETVEKLDAPREAAPQPQK
jgi:hypothetical protein